MDVRLGKYKNRKPKARIISLGLGVQSTAVYIMSSMGILPRADYAVFADPGLEHPRTYELLTWLQKWASKPMRGFGQRGIPIIHANEKNLYEDLLTSKNSTGQRWASIPAFTGKSGMLRRQCTREYKIEVIIKVIREQYGLSPKKMLPITEMWIGISMDEIHRISASKFPRMINYYPLIDKEMTRSDCRIILKEQGIPEPVKSACVFCPYQSDSQWKNLKVSYPDTFAQAVKIDETMRDSSHRKVREKVYLHSSRIPLAEVDFESQQDMFGEECEGYCGV